MKRHITALLLLAASGVLALAVHAQAPATNAAPAPSGTRELLEAMKTQNAALLQRQAALLLKFDELQKEAAQIKFLAKRG